MYSFEIYCGVGGLYHWRLTVEDELICWSEGFRTRQAAKMAVENLKAGRISSVRVRFGPTVMTAAVRTLDSDRTLATGAG